MKQFILYFLLSALLMSCETQRQTTGWNYNDNESGDLNTFRGNVKQEDNFNTESYLAGQYEKKKIRLEDGSPQDKTTIQKKIIYNAHLSLTVKEPDSTNKQLVKIAEKYDGYAQQLGTGFSMIRVRADQLDAALVEISHLGRMGQRNVQANDVTDNYYDFKIRLDNAEKARNRYLELLQKAQTVEETLKVEKELERLNGEIDLLKGKLNRINHLTDYATISIDLHKRVKPGLLGYVAIGVYDVVKWLFVRG